jgi:excisionase family DNA binding protein
MPPLSPLLRYKDAAKYLNISETTLYREIEKGRIPVVRITKGTSRLRREDLDRFILENTEGPSSSRGVRRCRICDGRLITVGKREDANTVIFACRRGHLTDIDIDVVYKLSRTDNA